MMSRISNASNPCVPISSPMSPTSCAPRLPRFAAMSRRSCTRPPLTAIRGYVETLMHTPPADPKESRQFLAIIDRHSERLSRLTQDLLTLSDLESGKIQLSPQPLDAAHLIQRVFEVFWDQAARKQVKLTQRIEPELPDVLGDLDRLQQLFINLVGNALKYTPSGGEIILEARSLPPRNGTISHIELAVIDT